MSKIKSQQALEYLHGTSNEKEFLNMADLLPLWDAIKAVIIAEQEAEERHANQLQELKDRAERAFYYSCNACDGDGGCRLRDNRACLMRCKKAKLFTQKLTEKL